MTVATEKSNPLYAECLLEKDKLSRRIFAEAEGITLENHNLITHQLAKMDAIINTQDSTDLIDVLSAIKKLNYILDHPTDMNFIRKERIRILDLRISTRLLPNQRQICGIVLILIGMIACGLSLWIAPPVTASYMGLFGCGSGFVGTILAVTGGDKKIEDNKKLIPVAKI